MSALDSPTVRVAVHKHTIVEGDKAYALKEDVQELADKLVDLQGTIQEHDLQAQRLVANALETMLEKLPEALEQATERAMRRVMTDKSLHEQVGTSVLEQATANMHRRVGSFIFSKWFALAALIFAVASAIGWPATLKAIFSLGK